MSVIALHSPKPEVWSNITAIVAYRGTCTSFENITFEVSMTSVADEDMQSTHGLSLHNKLCIFEGNA